LVKRVRQNKGKNRRGVSMFGETKKRATAPGEIKYR